MGLDEIIKEEKSKENIYKIISVLYYIPQEDMFEAELLTNLVENTKNLSPELFELAKDCKLAFQKAELDDLKVDHAQLFVGPFELSAPPYGSVYLEDGRTVMGDSTLDVIEKYKAAGLNTDDNFKEPPDHISVELEFMYYLTFNLIEEIKKEDIQAAKKYYQTQQDFLEQHLLKWIPEFSQKIEENAQNKAYKLLAKLTKKFLKYDYDQAVSFN